MKKIIWIIPTAVILGILASVLRGYELAFGFDLSSGLPTSALWVTPTLLAVGAVVAIAAFVIIRKKSVEPQEEKKSPVHTAVSFACSAIMLALAGYSVFVNQMQGEVIIYLFAALSLLNAASFAVLGVKNLRANDNPIYSIFTFIQVLWATLAVILVFRERVSEPIAEHFVFLLFAFLCILLFTYAQTGYVYGKNRIAVAYITGVLGTYLIAIELIAPFIAGALNVEYFLNLDFKIILPLAAYLIYMPTALVKILRNENNV